MPEQQKPMTKTINASTARQQWSELINQVYRKQTRVIVEKSGIPVAAVVSAADLARLEQAERERAERFKVVDEMRAAFQDVPSEEIEQETAKAVHEVRAQMRREREQRTADTK